MTPLPLEPRGCVAQDMCQYAHGPMCTWTKPCLPLLRGTGAGARKCAGGWAWSERWRAAVHREMNWTRASTQLSMDTLQHNNTGSHTTS